ncbi:MAG: hypothetical protein A2X64_02900 [Ignavibacteria bacterium GWF2_33_9]|nr:MAG: hypothetical protein A2X64_02900 [Ignavibacteria bacterium GWF2_33_9]
MAVLKPRIRQPNHGSDWLMKKIDNLRIKINGSIDPLTRRTYAQFMTPRKVAILMASLFKFSGTSITLLDPGAGIGCLSAAFVSEILKKNHKPSKITIDAFEIDPYLSKYLKITFASCRKVCREQGIDFTGNILTDDFIKASVNNYHAVLLKKKFRTYNCIITNPPYHKINTDSEARRLLREVGIETTNMYTAFIALAVNQLSPEGELVSISPRSFCNGPYFLPFRKYFFNHVFLNDIHLFESRKEAFSEDDVLQENVIIHATKNLRQPKYVNISMSKKPTDPLITKKVKYNEVIKPQDSALIIHIAIDENSSDIAAKMNFLSASLSDLGIDVSTGRVVDFRAKEFLKDNPDHTTVPLIYPLHFCEGQIKWPITNSKKPNAIVSNQNSRELLVPAGNYVLVKRFSAKEEKRRIVAAIYNASDIFKGEVGFENHLNYFHLNGKGLSLSAAKGLSLYLNSSMVDIYFRQFSGHTQVNASDLKRLKYPSMEMLIELGKFIKDGLPEQAVIDKILEQVVFN